MTYNFNDVAAPSLPTTILPTTGNVDLVNGSTQAELITSAYTGSSVTVTIVPPSGWTLASVSWSGGSGTLTVPSPGVEETHTFNYTVTQSGAAKSNGGVFKIKKAGGS